MRKLSIAAAALLAGCVSGPIHMVHKTGSTSAERQLAFDGCMMRRFKPYRRRWSHRLPGGTITQERCSAPRLGT
jgi:hypothetical protein